MSLSAHQLTLVATASSEGIAAGARRLVSRTGGAAWLARGNRYRADAIGSLNADDTAGTINDLDLAEYIAASAPLHCSDGWSYLGRAVACHLHGDADTARHLAYYAELRAAMGLLASQGIGIFNQRHFVVDSAGTSTRLCKSLSTHAATWEILEKWADLDVASRLLGSILRPADVPMSDWIAAIPYGAAWQPIATYWLLTMGLDLKHLRTDRDARNEASYRPTHLNSPKSMVARRAASVAHDMWRAVEPTSSSAFGELDRHLLRSSLETAFRARKGRAPSKDAEAFAQMISSVVREVDPTAGRVRWEQFLTRKAEPGDPTVISLARQGLVVSVPDHHASVMARALLLLRVASGASRQMLADADVKLDGLAFWWGAYGMSRGLWDAPPDSGGLTDTWADIEPALQDVSEWIAGDSPDSYRELFSRVPHALTELTSLEMVGLWSLAS